MVGISAMTAYVNRGYEIADEFRRRGVPVIMGGVHPSFMSKEALTHCDAVCIGEAELVLPKILEDLENNAIRGTYRSDKLHPMVGIPMPRYDLVKRHRYVNKTFVQTSRGCHQGCTFCAEPLMNGLKFRYRPIDEVMYEVDNCGSRMISINDADFFGTPDRPKEVMKALKGRKVRWQAGVTSKLAQDDRMLELAAESGCTMLSIGFESISRDTLKSVHKHVNRPEQFAELVEKVHSYGIAVFGLFMFGFDGDDTDTFQDTRTVQYRRELRRCRLFGAYPISRHAHLVRDEEGEPHRLLRLGEIRPGERRLSAGKDDRRRAQARAHRRLQDILRAWLDRPPLPVVGRAQRDRMVGLQHVHEEGLCDRPEGDDRRTHFRARSGAGAAAPAGQARMARRGAGGYRRVRGELFQRAAKRSSARRRGADPPAAGGGGSRSRAGAITRNRAQSFQP
jgi:radical SAM superfamily enzyme YgiQ (UPF0313 family)